MTSTRTVNIGLFSDNLQESVIVQMLAEAVAANVDWDTHPMDYREAARYARAAEGYTGSLTLSPQWAEVERMATAVGIEWTLDDDGTFTVWY